MRGGRRITEAANPAAKVAKQARLSSTRSALADDRIAELVEAASTTGNDPELDALIVRLHIETACRRGGALGLRPMDLDVEQCLIMLREKGGTFRWQPVSPTLMQYLVRHATERRAPGDGQLLRYANTQPVSRRRYDYLWQRLGKILPWVATQQVSAHWLRHTTQRSARIVNDSLAIRIGGDDASRLEALLQGFQAVAVPKSFLCLGDRQQPQHPCMPAWDIAVFQFWAPRVGQADEKVIAGRAG